MKCQREAGWCEALRMLCEDYLGVAPILPGDSVIIIRDACVKANLGWNRDNYCPLHLARVFLYNTGTKSTLYILVSKEAIFMSKIKEGTKKVAELIEAEQTRTNKELIIAAAVCTFVGIIIGFFIGKTTTSKNTVKKYNQCFSYDFGDEEEKEEA